MAIDRRSLLGRIGAATTVAAVGVPTRVAADTRVTNDEEPPEYARWLAADDGVVEFAYVDWASLERDDPEEDDDVGFEDDADDANERVNADDADDADVPAEEEEGDVGFEDEGPETVQTDPMMELPSGGATSILFAVNIAFDQYELGGLIDDEALTPLTSTADALLLTNEAFIITGTIEPEEIETQLTRHRADAFATQLERTDEISDYAVYTPVDNADDAAIAVGSDAIVFALGSGDGPEETVGDDAEDDGRGHHDDRAHHDDEDDTHHEGDDEHHGEDREDGLLAILERTIGVSEGEVERATDELEEFEWLISSAGTGDITVGRYGDRPDAEPDDSPADDEDDIEDGSGRADDHEREDEDVVDDTDDRDELGEIDRGLEEIERADGLVSSLTLEDEATTTGDFAAIIQDPDVDALESVLGISAAEQSVDVDEDRVTARATWRADNVVL